MPITRRSSVAVATLLALLALGQTSSAEPRAAFPPPDGELPPPPVAPPPSVAPPAPAPAPVPVPGADAEPAPAPATYPHPGTSWTMAPGPPPPDEGQIRRRVRPEPSLSDSWMLSAEGVTHAPIDMGLQLGLETPIGVRAFAGYGWVPSVYKNILISAAAEATGDPTTRTMLESGLESGSVMRVQIGLRPFEKIGLYLDVGYARMKLEGNVSSDELAAFGARVETNYDLESNLQLWEIELGYQFMIADRVVLAPGLGFSRVFDSSTKVTPSQGPIEDPLVLRASGLIDEQLEKYGILPHLTLRLGFDFI